MKQFLIAALLLAAGWNAEAQVQPVGGVTSEACATVTTSLSAYSAGYEVGPLISLTPLLGPSSSGILQSLRIDLKDAQTAEFDVTPFKSQPTASTWTDHQAPAIAAGDVFSVYPTIKLTTASSVLGTHTVYGLDGLGAARVLASPTLYLIITTPGTPTFGSAADMQICATFLRDS